MISKTRQSHFVEQISEAILHSALSAIVGRGFRLVGEPTGKITNLRHRPGQDATQGVYVRLGPGPTQAHLKVVGPNGPELWIRQDGQHEIRVGFLRQELPLNDRAKAICSRFMRSLSGVAQELKAGAEVACPKSVDLDNDMPDEAPSDRSLRVARIYLNHTNSTCQEVRDLRYLVNREQEDRLAARELTDRALGTGQEKLPE